LYNRPEVAAVPSGLSPSQLIKKIIIILARRGCEDMPIILAGDFNVNMKDNYNAKLVELMNDTF
jgi:hypothetical protein